MSLKESAASHIIKLMLTASSAASSLQPQQEADTGVSWQVPGQLALHTKTMTSKDKNKTRIRMGMRKVSLGSGGVHL